ncbi:MAG: hypothetical protein K8R69_12600 [Deltaproteobacteria bacterium]|nr:hypothetical protein [Deltaproteobacteria bacterium]
MKRLALFAALFTVLFAVNSYACDAEKKDNKDKAPQAQTTTTAPVAAQGTATGK